jgi:hypothetical protein
MLRLRPINTPSVAKVVQERPRRRFEAPQFHCSHFGAPISQARSNGKSYTRVENGAARSSSWPEILLVVEHGTIEGDPKELTKGDAFSLRMSNEGFVSKFVVSSGAQGPAKLASKTHVPLPP